MILRQTYQKIVFFVFACLLPIVANSTAEEVIEEKRVEVAMRMIGHEVLICTGDHASRIMPIERIDGQYKISFEFEFGFDPEEIVSIIDRIMTETNMATNYLVEVEQCKTKEIVHSFEIGNAVYTSMIPCQGRMFPKDCYSLLMTILDGKIDRSSKGLTIGDSSSTSSYTQKSVFLILLLLSLSGLIAYFIKKKNTTTIDPNLVIIGASRFDKRNRVLSFENKSIELSHKEADLLLLLHAAANEPIKRETILHNVWEDEGDYIGRTLDVFISKLRKKLEADASVKIVNIRGVGYKLVVDG